MRKVKPAKKSSSTTITVASVEHQICEYVAPKLPEEPKVIDNVNRRNFIKNAIKLGVGLPFIAQLILEGCGGGGGGGASSTPPSLAEGSAEGGGLDGTTLAVTNLSALDSENTKIQGNISLKNVTTKFSFKAPKKVADAFKLIETSDNLSKYSLILLDPDGNEVSLIAAVQEFNNRYVILVNNSGSSFRLTLKKASAASGGVIIAVTVIFCITLLAALLVAAGLAAYCIAKGGSPSFTIGFDTTKGQYGVSFECQIETGGSGSGGSF